MQFEFKKNEGFTLAEVLITLGIIGVIAALTIPTLLNFAAEQQAASSAKKMYSIINEAWLNWQNDKNCPYDNVKCLQGYDAWIGRTIGAELKPYLKTLEDHECAATGTNLDYDWLPTTVKKLDNNAMGGPSPVFSKAQCAGVGGHVYLLNDGMTFIVGDAYGPDAEMPKLIYFVFDINGGKSPNRVGKDQFIITTSKKALIPYYACYWGGWTNATEIDGLCNQASGTPCTPDDGHSPLAYILTHGSAPDLKAIGY